MTRLDCSVVNCVYNTDRCCGKGDILVEGQAAMSAGETCCSSFKERREGASNRCSCSPKEEIKVGCRAKHCKFNDESKCMCTADHIGIAGGKVCQSADTECASFSRA